MIQQIVQNILVYVVMMLVLRGLIGKKSYLEIFRFSSGLILIILCASPILSFLQQGDDWRQELEGKLFQRDFTVMEQEVEMTEGTLQEIMLRECREKIKDQIELMAENMGERTEKVQVGLKKNEDGELVISGISLWIAETSERDGRDRREGQMIKPIDIDVGNLMDKEGEDPSGASGEDSAAESPPKERTQDRQTRRLKREICDKFALSRKVVKVWRRYGKR